MAGSFFLFGCKGRPVQIAEGRSVELLGAPPARQKRLSNNSRCCIMVKIEKAAPAFFRDGRPNAGGAVLNIRFYNARILAMEGGSFEVTEGELWTEGNRISYVGPGRESGEGDANTPAWDREIDAKGNLLMPGFKNAHTHSAMTFLRSYADDLPLFDWLNKQVFPKEAQLTGDDIYWLTKLAIMEYLTSGVTANFDMYFHPEATSKAADRKGSPSTVDRSMELTINRKTTISVRVMAFMTRRWEMARPRRVTASRPRTPARKASSSTATVPVLTPPAVEPEEPPTSIRMTDRALLES